MIKRIAILVSTFAILVSANPAAAQQAGKVYRIGFLSAGSAEAFKPRMAAFRQGLRELGYSEGKNMSHRSQSPLARVRAADASSMSMIPSQLALRMLAILFPVDRSNT